jgi:hypothetical protein
MTQNIRPKKRCWSKDGCAAFDFASGHDNVAKLLADDIRVIEMSILGVVYTIGDEINNFEIAKPFIEYNAVICINANLVCKH